MSDKQDNTTANIMAQLTPEQEFLVNCLVESLTLMVMRDLNLPLIESLEVVYNSQLYEKITDVETGLYYQSPCYNYNLLRQELNPASTAATVKEVR